MKYSDCHLPNGLQVNVTPIFGGFKFKIKDQSRYGAFPPEWAISLRTKSVSQSNDGQPADGDLTPFKRPTLNQDRLFLSTISLPTINDLKPSSAPTRQVAMVLWVTFLWYFQEHDPRIQVFDTERDNSDPNEPTKDWQLEVQHRGILCRRDQMMKLERLGLLAAEDASVGVRDDSEGFQDMFISQRAFWQLDARMYLFSLSPVTRTIPGQLCPDSDSVLDALGIGFPFGAGPNTSGTFLPSYYPPQPLQYTSTDGIRHPVRPKAYRQGEVFYLRYIPSGGEYLTFRVPVLPTKRTLLRRSSGSTAALIESGPDLCLDSELANDLKLIHRWVQCRGTDTALTQKGSITAQSKFLEDRLSSRNSFPALACWDSTAIGYFELFWVLEDNLGRQLSGVQDWDRGVRCFIGNVEFLEPDHLTKCMTSLIHHCWLFDRRTYNVVFEFNANNLRCVYPAAGSGPSYKIVCHEDLAI